MKRKLFVIAFIILLVPLSYAGVFDTIKEGIGVSQKAGVDESTAVSGLKEALSVGTENAVKSVSQVDGYFGNELIKILMPKDIQKVANVLSKAGFQKQVDDFVLSMNRAAEKAAPKAASIFGDAVKEMSFEDAMGILEGGDTAATDYFRSTTSEPIYESFKPIVSESMNEVGVTRQYKDMMGKYTSLLPFTSAESVDLDHYVTEKAMDGLFHMIGEEEKKIRTDPAARVTDLLKDVFGN